MGMDCSWIPRITPPHKHPGMLVNANGNDISLGIFAFFHALKAPGARNTVLRPPPPQYVQSLIALIGIGACMREVREEQVIKCT